MLVDCECWYLCTALFDRSSSVVFGLSRRRVNYVCCVLGSTHNTLLVHCGVINVQDVVFKLLEQSVLLAGS